MSFSRRELIKTSLLVSGAFAAVPAAITLRYAPVLSFHLDQPWMDPTGTGLPYRPPVGARGAEAIAGLSDEALSRYYGVI